MSGRAPSLSSNPADTCCWPFSPAAAKRSFVPMPTALACLSRPTCTASPRSFKVWRQRDSTRMPPPNANPNWSTRPPHKHSSSRVADSRREFLWREAGSAPRRTTAIVVSSPPGHGQRATGSPESARPKLVVSDAVSSSGAGRIAGDRPDREEGDEHGHRAGRVAGRAQGTPPSTPRSSSSAPVSPASISCTCCVRRVSTSAWSRPAPTSGEPGTGTATRAPASTPRATPTATSSRPSCSPSGTGRSTSPVRPRPRRT